MIMLVSLENQAYLTLRFLLPSIRTPSKLLKGTVIDNNIHSKLRASHLQTDYTTLDFVSLQPRFEHTNRDKCTEKLSFVCEVRLV
jgi:hypothetical protein